MLDLAQAVREQIVKETPPRKTAAAPKTFTLAQAPQLHGLDHGRQRRSCARRLVGPQPSRRASAWWPCSMAAAAPSKLAAKFDAETVTRQLADAVRVLASNDEQLRSRVAAVEHDLDDVTGSIRQVAAASETRRAEDGPTVSATAALTASAPATLDHAPAPPPAPAVGRTGDAAGSRRRRNMASISAAADTPGAARALADLARGSPGASRRLAADRERQGNAARQQDRAAARGRATRPSRSRDAIVLGADHVRHVLPARRL